MLIPKKVDRAVNQAAVTLVDYLILKGRSENTYEVRSPTEKFEVIVRRVVE